jgi:hypothetical protein
MGDHGSDQDPGFLGGFLNRRGDGALGVPGGRQLGDLAGELGEILVLVVTGLHVLRAVSEQVVADVARDVGALGERREGVT